AAVLSGDVPIAGVGLWSAGLFAACVLALQLSSRYGRRHVWTVVGEAPGADHDDTPDPKLDSLRSLILKTAAAGGVILVAGFFLSQSGDAIAEQTGLGSSLVGLVLVGFATSLPELSSIVAALRMHRYEMAVGDIFGTNLFNIALIFVADLAYPGGPVLAEATAFEAVAALIALVMTGIFVLGLLERRDRTILRMGYDSLASIAIYAGGLLLLLSLP
ncbi:MAG TPA: sodium:calcium antiporter, partial [Afifellaceae bacterium]|nr:sodium:calcium antiporter [Afifellaceae bacterium]